MEVFNKLYSQVSSSVSSTVSQLSGVLPGNPVTREFDATTHIASAGPGLVWKIYKGCKRSTKQEASIFVFEKRQLDRWNKSDREIILESLRRGITQLTKIRHPQILTVQHPLEESRESLAFATEPVFASLANVLGKTTNMPQPANMSDYKLFDVEIKYGLLQISEGLAFLHNDVKLLHKNICPESIVLNKQGAWKIFGLDFCVHNTNPANLPPVYPCDGFSPTLPDICQSNLDYLAPECLLNQSHSPASDMFSVGMLAYILNSPGNKILSPAKDIQQFKSRVQQLKNLNSGKLQCIPEALREYVKLLLNVTPEIRPDAHQFARIPYFDDVAIKTLTYLDSLLQWDNLQKSQFYKGLPEALPKLPKRVKIQRVLSCLSRDLTQPPMVPFVLPSILDIAQECTKEEYCNQVLPHLKPVMKLMEPIQILLIMLQRMELLLKLTPPEDVQQHVLPMLYRGLDSDTPQIHELCLSVLPTFAGLLDHSNVKNSLLPRIKRLCLSTSSLSVRVNCLLCVGRLLEHLDKWLVLDEVLPFLPQIPSREPAVLMGILGIYKLAMNHKKLGISKEVIATRILPFLIPLCIENGLTLTQFNALVTLVKEMFQLVENEHRTKLEQLNSVKDEQKVLAAAMPTFQPAKKPVELDQAFSGLGLDSFVSMTLEEKQKVAQQQETFKTFQSQSALEPVKPVTNTVTTPPKNLTATLVSDWSSTNDSVATGANWANQNVVNRNVAVGGGAKVTDWSNMNISGQGKTNSNFNSVNANMGGAINLTGNTMNMGSTNWNSQNFGVSNPWGSNTQVRSNNNTPQGNWSALDSLLPISNTTSNKVSMNQMIGPKQPLIPNSSSSSSNNNALSKDEIMDLLS